MVCMVGKSIHIHRPTWQLHGYCQRPRAPRKYRGVCLELVELANSRDLDPVRASRSRPARHLADLSAAERRAAVAELGQPAYRADQLSRHYFGRLTDSADE